MVYRTRWKVVADALLPRVFRHWRSNKESIPPDLKECRSRTCTGLSVFQSYSFNAQNDLLPCFSELGELVFYSLYPLEKLGLVVSQSACRMVGRRIESSLLHYESLAQNQMVSASSEVW